MSDSQIIEDVFASILREAKIATKRLRLPDDWAEDLAQETFGILWEQRAGRGWPPDRERQQATLRRIGGRQAKRLSRSRARTEAIADRRDPRQRSGAPQLCRGLFALCREIPERATTAAKIEMAAVVVARDARVLNSEQHRVFTMLYRDRLGIAEVARNLRISSRAVQRRAARVSRRVENALVTRLESHITADIWKDVVTEVARQHGCRGRRLIDAAPPSVVSELHGGLEKFIKSEAESTVG